jgi:uncharacterized spore protein YtfJ
MTNLIEKMAESVPSWGAKLAYGEKTTLGGHEILPVALVVFGFGAGEGSGDIPPGETTAAGTGEGRGGGGGGYAVPVGSYIGGPDGVRFHLNPIALVVASIPLVTAAGWALVRISRAGK